MLVSHRRRFGINESIITIVILLAVIAVAVLATVFIKSSTHIEYEVLYNGIDGKGLIVRNEKFCDLSQYEKLDFEQFIDGDKIENGQKVVTAFKKGYIKATLDKLAETEKNIVTYQNQSVISSYDDKKINKFDFDIDVVIRNMSEDSDGFIELYTKLCSLMQEREDYIRENFNTDSNTYIQQLFADEKSLTESLGSWCDVLSAQNDGFIGFYCDGFENELNFEKVQAMVGQDVKNYLNKEYSSNNSGFKIVNGEKWYLIISTKRATEFTEGLSYPVYIGNDTQSEIGCVEKIINDKKGKALVVSFTENVEKYIDFRLTDVHLGERIEGFSVKPSFVKNNSVIIKNGREKTEVPISAVYSDEDRVIFTVDDALKVGQKVYRK